MDKAPAHAQAHRQTFFCLPMVPHPLSAPKGIGAGVAYVRSALIHALGYAGIHLRLRDAEALSQPWHWVTGHWAKLLEQARHKRPHPPSSDPDGPDNGNWLDCLPDGALILDDSSEVIRANAVAEHMLGQGHEAMQGKALFTLLPALPRNCSPATREAGCQCQGHRPCTGCLTQIQVGGTSSLTVEVKFARLARGQSQGRYLVLLRDVTEAHKAELALGRNERLLRRILEALPVGVWVTDPNGEVLFDNPAGRNIWGNCTPFSPDATTAWWPAGCDSPNEPLPREICPPGTTMGMYEIRHGDGEVKTVACLRAPLWNGEQSEGTLIVQQDLSEFYRVEKDLRLADAMLERLLNSLAIGVVVTDLQRSLVMCNDTLCKLLGYGKMDLGRMALDDLLHPSDALACQDDWDAIVAGRKPWLQREVRCVSREGDARWALIHASVVREPEGRPLYLVAQVVDIDARKQAEKSLAIREHLFTMAQRIARLGYWEWQPLERSFNCSPEAAHILGVSIQSHAPLETLLTAVHPDDRLSLQRCLQALVNEGQDFDLDCRLMATACAGQHRIVKLRGTQLAPEVAAAHFVGTVIDVTEYQDMVRQLWASRDSLRLLSARQEKLLEDERKHIAMELHDELGQLLTGIKMNNSAIQLRKSDDQTIAKQTRRIEELAEKAIGVVRQVATSLRPLVMDMGLIAALSWQARNFQRMFGIPCELAIRCRDLPRNEHIEITVFRVVQEALTNVSRHAAASKVWIEMDIESGDQLAVRIKDNGNGFDPDNLIPGKTLGLLGQKERMHGLGGSIDIESLPGTGTTVILTIPIISDPTTNP